MGLRSVKLKTYIRERWTPDAAVLEPGEKVEEEAPAEEPKPKKAKKKASKKKTSE